MNWLLVNSLNIMECKAGILGNPAGIDYSVRKDLKKSPLMLKYWHIDDIDVMTFRDDQHKQNCGDIANHMYINMKTVAPGAKRTGLGNILGLEVNKIADQTDSYVYINCTDQRNLDFCKKQGFQVVSTRVIKNTVTGAETTEYGMIRPNKSGNRPKEIEEISYLTINHTKEE